MAEWLRTGLQIRLRRFDSGSGLQTQRWYAALAQSVEHIIRNDGVTGSNPVSGTTSFTKKIRKIRWKALPLGNANLCC